MKLLVIGGCVITSYSIHYTKLYEGRERKRPGSVNRKRRERSRRDLSRSPGTKLLPAPLSAADTGRTEADGALVAPPDFKSGREAAMSPVGSIPSRFRQPIAYLMEMIIGSFGVFIQVTGTLFYPSE